jgi:hypothetical protein
MDVPHEGRLRPSTTDHHARILSNFGRYVTAQGGTLDTADIWDVLEYVGEKSQTLLPQSVKEYISVLRSAGRRLRLPFADDKDSNGLLADLQASLHENVTLEKCAPLQLVDVKMFTSTTDEQHAQAAMLAWKSASRIDEIMRLCRNQVHVIGWRGPLWLIAIHFMDKTKASVRRPFRADMTTIIGCQTPMPLNLPTDGPIFPNVSTASMYRQLQKLLPSRHTGAHSFKRGALTHLVSAMKNGTISQPQIDWVMKHGSGQPAIQDVTMRYATMTQAREMAIGWKIHEATASIPDCW